MKLAIGIRRLDDLLGGGLPEKSAVLAHGPPFAGKELVGRNFLLAGLRGGTPCIHVLTDCSAAEAADRLTQMDPRFPEYLKQGLVHFVDAYSRTVGVPSNGIGAAEVDGILNFNAIANAVAQEERAIIRKHAAHRLVLESVSTLMAYTNAQTTFRFLQVLIGRSRAAGATGLYMLERGMHSDPDVQSLKHLMTGVIEFKNESGKNFLRAEGLGLADQQQAWVDYRFSDAAVEITGSFSAGRIR